MKCPGHKDKEKRDYKCENKAYGSRPDQKKRRAARNKARSDAEKKGLVRKGDGKDVHHTQPNGEGAAAEGRPPYLCICLMYYIL